MRKIILLTLISIALPSLSLYPQDDRDKLIRNEIASYLNTAEDNAVLYVGISATRLIHGNLQSRYLRPKGYAERDSWGTELIPGPFMDIAESYTEGDLFWDGMLHTNIKMRLDLYRDKLFIITNDLLHDIEVDPKRLDYAIVQDYRVVYISKDDIVGLPEGYYLELYSGNFKVYKKERFLYNDVKKDFVERRRNYYIVDNEGIAKQVKSRRSILKFLNKHKSTLNQYIRDNYLRFKEDADFENSIVLLVAEYEKYE